MFFVFFLEDTRMFMFFVDYLFLFGPLLYRK